MTAMPRERRTIVPRSEPRQAPLHLVHPDEPPPAPRPPRDCSLCWQDVGGERGESIVLFPRERCEGVAAELNMSYPGRTYSVRHEP